jgi:hypothetical protein
MSDSTEATAGNPLAAAASALTGDKPLDTTAAPAAQQGDPAEPDPESLGEGGKKALKAEREARTAAERKAAELKARLDEIEAANLSDLERAQKEAKDAQEAAAKAAADVARLRLATRYGLTEDEAADLPDDPEKAERLAARLAAKQTDTTTTPKPDLTQGAQNAPALNGDELTEALARAVGAR